MNAQQLFENIKAKRSFLCVGLDTDIQKIPEHLLDTDDPLFNFNKEILDAVAPYTVSIKPNLAFYESLGSQGMATLEKTVEYIKDTYPDLFVIADAKRGDIGNTASLYARSFFSHQDYDAVTIAPYMGEDSVKPFMAYEDKWSIILALTSNAGSKDFQMMEEGGEKLFERVIRTSKEWGTSDNTMYVVGATKAEMLGDIRSIIPDHFLLVPGVGAQGGSLELVSKFGMNNQCGLLVNSSRGIIYADSTEDYAKVAGEKAKELQEQMEEQLKLKGLI